MMLLWMAMVAGAIIGGNHMSADAWFFLTVGCWLWHTAMIWIAISKKEANNG